MRGTQRRLRRFALLAALATAGVLVVGAQAASAQVIEICKSSANGMSGRTFSYTVAPSNGAPFGVNVVGGRCSGPISQGLAGATTATITEAVSDPPTDVKSITVRPSVRKLSENLAGRSVTVTTGATTASETLVTFVNQPAGGNFGTLKVCKVTETPAFLGRAFSFSVNGGPLQSTEANDAFDDPANYTCRILGTFQAGSVVNVHEQVPAGVEVQWIDTDPGENLVDFNTTSGDATVLITPGTTVVYYDDEPAPPSGTGYIEVCKNADPFGNTIQTDGIGLGGYIDYDVHGSFHFTVTDAALVTHELDVLAGQCSEPIQVAAGVNEVVEAARSDTVLTDVDASPEDRLLTVNLINRTATVEVPVSDSPNDETQVFFFNELLRGQLKLCKALGSGSADLVGQQFELEVFDVSDPDHPYSLGTRRITAGSTTQCAIFGFVPIGTPIKVVENFSTTDDEWTKYDETGQYITNNGPAYLTIAPGVNTATITNQARGRLEICKAKIRTLNDDKQPTFTFRVDGTLTITVQAGKCSTARDVTVGSHTVSESATLPSSDYELDSNAPGYGIVVYPADREVSRNLNTRTVTVNVPYAFGNGETVVTFINRVKLGAIKVCKEIPMTSEDSLGMKHFTYTVEPNITTLGPISPHECSFFTQPLPILNADGTPRNIKIFESSPDASPSTYTVTSATCAGCRMFVWPYQNNVYQVNFNLGPGTNVVTYNNKSTDP